MSLAVPPVTRLPVPRQRSRLAGITGATVGAVHSVALVVWVATYTTRLVNSVVMFLMSLPCIVTVAELLATSVAGAWLLSLLHIA